MTSLRTTFLAFGLGAAAFTAPLVACSDDGSDSDQPDGSATTSSSSGGSSSSSGGSSSGGSSSGGASSSSGGPAPVGHFVYVQTNDTVNGVFAWKRADDGSLTAVAGSPFATGGAGYLNPTQMLGPDDSDQELVTDAAHRHLFVVNGGSDTVAVLDIGEDGSLVPVAGSPFPSGGHHPVGVGVSGNNLVVVNQGETTMGTPTGVANYTVHAIGESGALTLRDGALPAGRAPSAAIFAPSGTNLFGVDFMGPLDPDAPAGPLRSFTLSAAGALTNAAGTPKAIPVVDGGMPPGTPLALGFWPHPTQKILYVNFVLRKEVATYTYTDSGELTFVTSTPVAGPAPCWVRTNPAADRLYVTTTGDNSFSVLDASNPMAPVEIQHLQLAQPGPTFDNMGMTMTSSESFQIGVAPDGKSVYVVSQRATPDVSVTAGNTLHTLVVGADGMVSEPTAPLALDVPPTARPQGVVVF